MFWLSQYLLKKQDEHFLQALLDTKAQIDEVSEKQIKRVLFLMRWKRAVEPYLYIFKLAWETIRGRYRTTAAKIRGSADETSGGGAGAAGQPVAQFTGHLAGAVFAPTPPTFAGGIGFPPTQSSALPAFEDAGIVAGEVVAYRCWQLKPDGLLYSIFCTDFCWRPGKIVEGDVSGGDGIHAFKTMLLMAKYAMCQRDFPIVTGTVELWGEVYEHERGYRASKAAIKSIDFGIDYDAKALRKLYGLNRKKPRKQVT